MAPPFGVPRVRRCSAGSLPRLPDGLAGPAGLRYRFGSLQLDSSVRLPGFDHRRRSGDDGPRARFRFQLHETVTGAAVPGRLVLASGLRRLTIRRTPDGAYVVAAPPAAACTLLPDRHTIRWHLDGAPRPADAEFLVDTVLPRAATAQGGLVLHAAAVRAPQGALLLCGRSGAGKSTLSTAIAARTGWPLLGDDSVALETVGPVVRVLGLSADARLRVRGGPGALKRRLRLQEPACDDPPVRLIVRLVAGGPPAHRRPGPGERLIVLRNNLLRVDRADPDLAARELARRAEAIRLVDLVELTHPGTPQAVEATVERIVELAT